MNTLERLNLNHVVYVAYNSEGVQFGSVSQSQVNQFARLNKCDVSKYPIGSYMENKENNFCLFIKDLK